jgi:beta-lactamase class A
MTFVLSRRHALAGLLAAGALPASLALPGAAMAAPQPQDLAALGAPDHLLEKRLLALASGLGDAKIGIAAVELDAGRTASVNGGEMFALQGISPLPVATTVLLLEERGEIALGQIMRLTAMDIAPGRSPLAERLRAAPVKFTIRQLLEHMLLNADGTATDALMRLVGGPARIHRELARAGLKEGIRIDRYEREIQPAVFGLKPDPALADPQRFAEAIDSLDPKLRKRAQKLYLQDPRDTGSPQAIASFYAALARGGLLSRRNSSFVLDLLRRTKTGQGRLAAGIGRGWSMAHRSGQTRTTDGFTAVFSDSGIATSPDGARIAMVVFVEGASRPVSQLKDFQQQVSRTILDAWQPPSRA